MIIKQKIEVISFRDFMSGPAAQILKKTPLETSIYSFLPPITLKSFFPVHDPLFALFLASASLIAAIAFLEKIIAIHGFSEVTETISNIMKVILPIIGYVLIFWFLFTL